jgi:hypothetical protein
MEFLLFILIAGSMSLFLLIGTFLVIRSFYFRRKKRFDRSKEEDRLQSMDFDSRERYKKK